MDDELAPVVDAGVPVDGGLRSGLVGLLLAVGLDEAVEHRGP